MTGFWEAVAAVAVRRAHDMVETAAEAALQAGDRGVLVRTRQGVPAAAAPDERVPYGELWHVPEGVDVDDLAARQAARRAHPASGPSGDEPGGRMGS